MKRINRSGILVVVSVLWLGAVAFGTGALLKYSNVPNADGLPPAHWPTQTAIPHTTRQPTLVMFVHPHCPCTHASMDELAELMAHSQGLVAAHIIFFHADGTGDDWTHSDLWRTAAAIPGVTVQSDPNGQEARLFHAETSGHTSLYNAEGELVFDGGITASRGHEGDNAGLDSLMALLHGKAPEQTLTPVYGCLILDPKSKTSAGAK